ncbi:MAG: fibronectin type III domain-containing protein [Treponema sp.]|nr:fibronectin type III domain-containing protein [Treponema sp.]
MLKNRSLTVIVFALFSLFAMLFAGCTLEGDIETLREKVMDEQYNSGYGTIPNTPSGITATATSSSSITVSWNAVSGAAYDVYRSLSSNSTYTFLGRIYTTSYIDTGLSENTPYYYMVSAYRDGLYSQSAYASATTLSSSSGGGVPSTPTGVTATAISSSSITLNWDTVSGAGYYYVYRSSSSSGTYDVIEQVFSTSYTDTGLSSNTTYYYKVTSGNYYEESPQSTYTSATTWSSSGGDGAPSAPTGVTAEATSSSSITVSWDTVSGATSYNIYFNTDYYSTYSYLGNVYSTSFTDYGLSASTTYYYKVSAINDYGEGPQSAYASATTSSSGYGLDPIDLQYDVWHTSSLSPGTVDQYRFYAGSGMGYYIDWEDDDNSYESADIKVGVKREGSSSYTVAVTDDGNTEYDNSIWFSVSVAGYYIIEVHGYSSNSSGSYRIKWSDK